MDDLSQLRICVEKPIRGEEHAIHNLYKKSNSIDHYKKLKAAFYTAKLWPKGSIIKLQFLPQSSNTQVASWTMIEEMKARRDADGSPSPIDPIEYEIRKLSHQDAVKKVIQERIAPITDLKFDFVETGGNVRIGFDASKGSWSMLGTDCLRSQPGEKTMNFAWMDAATIMHECGHLLGMIHEHDNPDQNPIQWNLPALYKWAEQTQGWTKAQVDHNIVNKYKISQLNASKFDPYSIMLYFFPASLTLNHKATNINQRLSPVDVTYISKIYPGGALTPNAFYKKAYGKSIDKKTLPVVNISVKKLRSLPHALLWIIPLFVIILIIVILIIRFVFFRKKKRRYF